MHSRLSVNHLSSRERETLWHAAQGLTDKEIALKVGVSLTTVRTYWERLRQKTGAVNRASAVALYVQSGAPEIANLRKDSLDPDVLMQVAMQSFIGGLLILDTEGTVVCANKMMCKMLNQPSRGLDGRAINRIVTDGHATFHSALDRISTCATGSDPLKVTVTVFMKVAGGPDLLASATIQTLGDARHRHVVVWVQDFVAEIDARRRGVHSS